MKPKRLRKKNLYPPMTPGEMTIWSAAYAIEFNRWTCGDTTSPQPNIEVNAARIALGQAALAVLSARAALAANRPPLIAMSSEFARQMVRPNKETSKKIPPRRTTPKRFGNISGDSCDCWEAVNDREGKTPCEHERLPAGGGPFHNSTKPGLCRCGAEGPPWKHRAGCVYD